MYHKNTTTRENVKVSLGYPFTAIPNQILTSNVGPFKILVLLSVMSFAGPNGTCFASFQTIASRVGISRREVIRCMKWWGEHASEYGIEWVENKQERSPGHIQIIIHRMCAPSDSQSPASDYQSPPLVTTSHPTKIYMTKIKKEYNKKKNVDSVDNLEITETSKTQKQKSFAEEIAERNRREMQSIADIITFPSS